MEIRDAAELRTTGSLGGEKATVTRLHPLRRADGLIAVDLWVLEPGGKVDAHKHGEEHVIFVLAGAIEVSGGGASSSVVSEGGVISIEGGETHGLRNRGSEAARLLVSTPLLVRSERGVVATELPGAGASASPAATEGRLREHPLERSTARVEEANEQPDVQVRHVTQEEDSVPDISGLMKRGSDLVGVQRPERKRRPNPPSEEEETAVPEEGDADEMEDGPSNLMELFVAFEGGTRDKPPGQGFGSFMVQAPGRKPVVKRMEFGDNFTVPQSEYETLIACVEYITERLDATGRGPNQVQLDIRSDSNSMVNQLLGTERVKDAALRKRLDQAQALLDKFADWRIEWHDKAESVRLLGG